jgi:HPt (histidine-containing phosphotransfer) domain-containing protein
MPEMDGLDATRLLRRELDAARQPRVVAMTANAMQGDRERCLAAGMNDYVTKPIRINELVRALRESHPLRERHAEAAVSTAEPSAPVEPASVETAPVVTTSPAGVEASPLDIAVLRELLAMLGDDFSSLVQIIDAFLEDAPDLLAQLRGFIETGDAVGVRRVAHGLKSNGADFGARVFSDLCRDLEMIGLSGQLDGADDLFARIEAEFDKMREALLIVKRDGQIAG